MGDAPDVPRLRQVEAFPLTVDGETVICLRDPSGLTDAVLSVPRPAVEILALLDGTRALLDVQAELMRRHGELMPRDVLERLLDTLERHLFLEGPRVEAERARLATGFHAGATRPAFHAGKAYPADPGGLTQALDALLGHGAGPGPAGPGGGTVLRGLIAPHIDFARGGPAYAWAYRAVAEAADVDCFVVLGTAHAGLDGHPFAATSKSYETPLGPMAVDDEVLGALARRAPTHLFAAELAHRVEHSIEFQAVCLKYLHRNGGRDVRIVPLLASFVHECLARGRSPGEEPAVAGVLEALQDTMATVPWRYCLVAGADLAHVGPRFGDPAPVTTGELARVESEDRALLDVVARGSLGGFFGLVRRDGDRRRTCGLSPIAALLGVLGGAEGRLLHYGQWPDPDGTVTFASLAFEEPAR